MKMVRWQKHLMDLFTDAPTVRFGRSDLPDHLGILGPDIAVTREETGGYTSVTAYPRTPADHFRLAALLEAIGQDITEIPEDAEPLEIPYQELAQGTVRDLYRWAENYGFKPGDLLQILLADPDIVDLLDNTD